MKSALFFIAILFYHILYVVVKKLLVPTMQVFLAVGASYGLVNLITN